MKSVLSIIVDVVWCVSPWSDESRQARRDTPGCGWGANVSLTRGVTGAERPRGGTECDRKNRLECSELWNAILWLGRNWRFSGAAASGLRRGPQYTRRLEEEVSGLMLFLPLLSVVKWEHKGFYLSIDPCYMMCRAYSWLRFIEIQQYNILLCFIWNEILATNSMLFCR